MKLGHILVTHGVVLQYSLLGCGAMTHDEDKPAGPPANYFLETTTAASPCVSGQVQPCDTPPPCVVVHVVHGGTDLACQTPGFSLPDDSMAQQVRESEAATGACGPGCANAQVCEVAGLEGADRDACLSLEQTTASGFCLVNGTLYDADGDGALECSPPDAVDDCPDEPSFQDPSTCGGMLVRVLIDGGPLADGRFYVGCQPVPCPP